MSHRPVAVYLTHPEVVIDPSVAVPDWRLSPEGAARVDDLCARLGDVSDTQVISSAERKALETAWPLAALTGAGADVRPGMHENDRSATGYLAKDALEAAADAFFAAPEESFQGWERAVDAQSRIVAEVHSCIQDHPNRSLVFCGHGAVGTLLYCHLSGQAIDRKWDQTGGGHWFAFDPQTLKPFGHWRPMEQFDSFAAAAP